MFVLVTLRFLSSLPVTLIASLLYFFHVSAVCFNVWLKLSIKDNVLLNSMYKSCPLFVVTTKIELSMPVQSLNIHLSRFPVYPARVGGRGGGGRRRRHNQLHPCSAVSVYPVLDTRTSSYKKLSYAGRRSTNFLKSTVFFYLARLLLLCRFLYTINVYDFIFFCVFHGFLKKKYFYFNIVLAWYQYCPWRAIFSTIS